MLIYKQNFHLFNYACLQVLVKNNAYVAKQLHYIAQSSQKHPKYICSNVQSCYLEVDDVKKHTQKIV